MYFVRRAQNHILFSHETKAHTRFQNTRETERKFVFYGYFIPFDRRVMIKYVKIWFDGKGITRNQPTFRLDSYRVYIIELGYVTLVYLLTCCSRSLMHTHLYIIFMNRGRARVRVRVRDWRNCTTHFVYIWSFFLVAPLSRFACICVGNCVFEKAQATRGALCVVWHVCFMRSSA